MARGPSIIEIEKEAIRIGVSRGASYGQIARYLNRTVAGVSKQAKAMREDGTIDNLPLCFLVERIGEAILEH